VRELAPVPELALAGAGLVLVLKLVMVLGLMGYKKQAPATLPISVLLSVFSLYPSKLPRYYFVCILISFRYCVLPLPTPASFYELSF